MGCYSWMYADTDNQEALHIGERGYLISPEGEVIEEECYGGYGMFGGYDIYEKVAEWNRDSVSCNSLKVPNRNGWGMDEEGDAWFQIAMARYDKENAMLNDYISRKGDAYMINTYGEDWKREIGILMVNSLKCQLRYPIKICKKVVHDYDSLPASEKDSLQGCY